MSFPAHCSAAVLRWKGVKIVGTLNRPAGSEKKRFPAVLLLHGFPGAEKSVDVQRLLLKKGIASFAPHFAGAWGSGGTYRFTTLVDQARFFLRYLASRDFVDPKRLAVYGFSMGGWTALNLAARSPRLRACLAVAPVGGPEMAGRGTLELVRHLSRPLNAPAPRALAADFDRAVTVLDANRAAARLGGKLLLVHGTADDVVPCEISRRLHACAPGSRLVVARGARHDFLDRRERLAALAVRWLASRLR